MNLKPIKIVAIMIFFICGCGENPKNVEKEYREIQNELINNYKNKNESFDKLSYYFKLNHVTYIEFLEDKRITVAYKLDNVNDTGEWKSLENKDIASEELKPILDLDSLSITDLLQLKNELAKINIYSIWLHYNYDATKGRLNKEIDLAYKRKMNAINFFYRIFQEPLDSIENGSFSLVIQNNTTGGILSDKVIWFNQ